MWLMFLFQGRVEAADQDRPVERFGQEAHCTSLQRSRAQFLGGERRDENERHAVPPDAQKEQQLDAGYRRHLDVRDDTRRIIQMGRM